ncbi:unnamed protein product [Cylicocyclus nassatus]|uniref:Uncharacterized protein n=1 Tax=Cylicocyclus nassatus TaxID=53992 RepID=A0AA36GKU5_CYLNA|nr:unnamed protein product [Cylicocyclus nassatus]
MSDEKDELLKLINSGKYEEALNFLGNFGVANPERLRKLSIDTIFDAATRFRDNNDDKLRVFVLALLDFIHPETLKFRICFNFITGRTTPHFAELLTSQLRSIVTANFLESHPEWDELRNVLPLKLEEHLAKEDDPNVLESALAAADILYALNNIPFVLPERMTMIFTAAVHSAEMDLPRTFPLLFYYAKTHPFFPKLLSVTEPTPLIPCVYSRTSLGRYLIIGLTKYLRENEYNYERFFVTPVTNALAHITSLLEGLNTSDIDLCSKLILPLLRFVEDFEQQAFRVTIMDKCREIVQMFPSELRVLLIKRILTMVLDSQDLHLENEAAVVAWFVDQYRRDLDEDAFREEVGSFLGLLENTRYDNMSLAANYYSSVFVLIQSIAMKRINPSMLPELKTRLIQPIYDQISDYIQLQELREKEKKNKDPRAPALPEGMQVDVGPSFEGSVVDQMQLMLFECEQARSFVEEALRSISSG